MWNKVKLSDVCKFQNGFAFQSALFKTEGIPLLRISNIQDSEIVDEGIVYINPKDYKQDLTNYLIKENDLLIAMSGATTGKLGINKNKKIYYQNQRVGRFVPNDSLDKRYLFYYLLTKVQENLAISVGSAQPNLSTEQIKNFLLPLPQLEEQKRIVEKIEELFSNVDSVNESLNQLPLQLYSYQQSILKSVFFSKKYKNFSKLGDRFKILSGGTPSTKVSAYWGGDTPWITSASIQSNEITIEKKVTKEGIKNSATHVVPKGSILVVTRVGLGKVAVAPCDMCFSQDIQALLPSSDYDQKFLLYFLSYVAQSFQHASRGTTISGITKKQLEDIMIPNLNITEQKNIIKIIESQFTVIKANRDNIEKILSKVSILKLSILNKAFSGELLN